MSHTTNYTDAFILVAADCPAERGTQPPPRKNTTLAERAYAMLEQPYAHTSDEVLFTVFADARELMGEEREEAREAWFSRGQACLRASALTKRYGWGVHFDREGRAALVGVETEAYGVYASGVDLEGRPIEVVRAMRNKRA
ncbi:MAG: hypothetical protein EP330_01245 [Deltaproteobacteria bacterium]|nr:MAG: hypothetical protein EP330_01245 [Deltaproteobacteria bacterium]